MLHLLIFGAAISQISKSDDVATININDVQGNIATGSGDLLNANNPVAPSDATVPFTMTVGTISNVRFEQLAYGQSAYCDFETFNEAGVLTALPTDANSRKLAQNNMFGLCVHNDPRVVYPSEYESIRKLFDTSDLCKNAEGNNAKLTRKEAADVCSWHPACWGFQWGNSVSTAQTRKQSDNAKGSVRFYRIPPPGVASNTPYTDDTTALVNSAGCYRKTVANGVRDIQKMHSIDHAVFSGKTIYADPDDKGSVNAGHGIVCFLAAVSVAYIGLYVIVYIVSKIFDQKFSRIAKIYPSGPRSMIEGHMGGEHTYSLFM